MSTASQQLPIPAGPPVAALRDPSPILAPSSGFREGENGEPVSASSRLRAQLERRLELFHRMTASLVRGRTAIVARNLDGILEATAEQESLCAELRHLLAQTAANPAAQVAAALPADLCRRLREAQEELRFASRINQILLNRSSFTATVLSRLYLSCSGTYTNPAAERR
jgi:hypothetical protein